MYGVSEWAIEQLHTIIDDEDREEWAHRLITQLCELQKAENSTSKFNTQKTMQEVKQINKSLRAVSDHVVNNFIYHVGVGYSEIDNHSLDNVSYFERAEDEIINAIELLKNVSSLPLMPPSKIKKAELIKFFLPHIMGIPLAEFTASDFSKESEAAEILACVYQELGSTTGLDATYQALHRLFKDIQPLK